MEVDPEDIQEAVPEEADSYDELAAAEPEAPQKRARGRPKGSRNKPKIEKTEEEIEEIEEIPSPPPSPPPTPTPAPKPKTRKSRAKPQQTPAPEVLDVEFDEGYGATGPPSRREKPVRMKQPPQRTQSVPTSTPTDLMHVLAAFAKEHGTREKERKRGFYEMYLPN